MQQKDYALIIASIGFSAIIAIILATVLFGGASKRTLKAPKVQAITADFALPDSRFFNANSINPTQVITIGGDQTNDNPFNNQ